MSRFSLARPLAALALTAALAVPAFAQPRLSSDRPDAAARIARATDGLALSTDQRQRLDAVASRHATDTPGASWALAAEVAGVLTPAQTAQLQQAGASRRESRGARDERPDGAARLTEAQRDALREAMEGTRPQMDALVERFRSGAVTPEALRAERERLAAERRVRVDALLTPEQRQARAAMEARREADRTARVQALGLTAQQQSAMEALALERIRTAPPRGERSVAPTDPDRSARRAAMEQTRDRAEAILTPEQRAIMAVHRALGGDRMHRRGGDAHGRRSRDVRNRTSDQ